MLTGFQDSVGWLCHHSFLNYSVLFSNFSLPLVFLSVCGQRDITKLCWIYSSVKRDVPISSFAHIPFFGFASMFVQSSGGWNKHQ